MQRLIVSTLAIVFCGPAFAFGQFGGGTSTTTMPTTGTVNMAEIIKKFDRNGDGILEPVERAAAGRHLDDFLRRDFASRADTNGDGKIDVSERQAAQQAMEKDRFKYMQQLPNGTSNNNANTGGNANAGNNANTSNNANRNAQQAQQARQRLSTQSGQMQQGQGSYGGFQQELTGKPAVNNANGNAAGNSFGPGGVRPGQGSSFGPKKK